MKKITKKKYIYLIIVISIITGLVWLVQNKSQDNVDKGVWAPQNLTANESQSTPILNAENSTEFKHPTHSFSFRYPSDLKLQSFSEDSDLSEVILAQNAEAGRGFQITISPFDENTGNILTEERIKLDVPDLIIKDTQPLLIGENGQGLAFLSDNEDFGGNSREVWFVFNGFLYQISTYAHLDPILQSMFATWKFEIDI